jgi:hypothetical protein
MRFAATELLMPRRVQLVLLLLLSLGGAEAHAETPYAPENYEFLERQYVFGSPQKIEINGQRDALALEAQVGPHVTLWGRGWGPDPRLAWNDELRVLFTFQTQLRLVTSDSAPVVTPSYLPQLRVQWLRRRTYVDGVLNPSSDWRWGLTLDLFSHHSNGQDGCTLLPLPAPDESPTPSRAPACARRGTATGINERNGSFSTNHLGLNVHARWSPQDKFKGPSASLIGTLGVQLHHDFPGGGLSEELERLWGRWHVHGELEGRRYYPPDVRQGYGYLRYRLDAMTGGHDPLLPGIDASHWRHTAELGAVFAKLHELGVFLRLVTGREYYNIEFAQEVTRLQLGITIDTFGQPAHFELLTQEEARQLSGTPPPSSPPPDDEPPAEKRPPQ